LADTDTLAKERELRNLYFASFGFITDAALDDKRLTQEDAKFITDGVAQHLSRYDGALTEDGFERWVLDIIKPAVAFYGLKRECGPYVRAAIRRKLGYSDQFDDYRAVAEELESEVWIWALLHLEELAIPGTASLRTRLYKRAQWMVRAYLKKQYIRFNMISQFASDGRTICVEHLSAKELASMRADAMETE